MIRIGIFGYGNLGRGVECAVKQNSDMELVAIFTRRDPSTLKPMYANTPVYKAEDAQAVVMEYLPVLLEDGFTFYGEKVEKDFYLFYREVEIQGDEGYLITAILVEGEKITVAVLGDDEYKQTKSDIEEKLAP